jgi:fumarate hydratase class I
LLQPLDARAETAILRRASLAEERMDEAEFHELFPLGADDTPYRRLTADHVSIGRFEGARIVKVAPEALTLLAREAFIDCQHLLRPSHLAQLRAILDDPEASANDKFVAFDLLKNANIAAGKVLPMCQDTGTAIVIGKKGQQVWTGGNDAAALSAGIRRTYTEANL